jgi:hypothetical protein
LEQEPIDTLSLIETKNDDTVNLEKGWIPQSNNSAFSFVSNDKK